MELKRVDEEETIIIFHIMDYKVNNLFKRIKIIKEKNELISFPINKINHKINLKINEKKEKIIIFIELLNDKNTISFKAEIIAHQINNVYILVNRINKNIIDLYYKNFRSKKEHLKSIEIIYEKKTFQLFFQFIDAKERVGKLIIMNVSLNFEIKLDLKYSIANNENHNWLFCVKQYENKLILTCHIKFKNNNSSIENTSIFYNQLKNYKIEIIKLIHNEKYFVLFMKLKEIYKEIIKYIKTFSHIFYKPIDNYENFSEVDFLNLDHLLYLKNIYLCYYKYSKELLENEKENNKKMYESILINFDKTIRKSIDNYNKAFKKLVLNKTLDYKEKGKKLAIINSILIENPEKNFDIEDLQEINIDEIEKKNKNNYYVKARAIFKDIILNLSSDSLLTQCGIELNSNYSKNYNIFEEEYSTEINIITLEDLRDHLIKLIPKKLYRIYYNSDNFSYYEPISKDITMNEKIIFEDMDKNKIETIFNSVDKNGNYTLCVLVLFFHEIFGHSKVRFENYKQQSPLKFNYKGYLVSLLNKDDQPYSESGRIVEKYLTEFNIENKNFLISNKTYDVNSLLDYKLYIGDLTDFNKMIFEINNKNDKDKSKKEVSNFKDFLQYYKSQNKKIDFDELKEDEFYSNIKKYLADDDIPIDDLDPKKNNKFEYIPKLKNE